MSTRKALLAAVIPALLASVLVASTSGAQCTTGPGSGSTNSRAAATTTTDQGGFTGFDFDLFARLQAGAFSMHSWGRGPAGHPGTVRSSFAVLRERLGLRR
jgi:hypothetical protein